jgi:integrase
MKGNIEARGTGRWRVRVFAGREDGRTKFVSRTVSGTKRDAQVALAKLVTEVEGGQVERSHPVSVSALVDRWLDAVSHERSAYTMLEYRRLASTDIKPALGTVRLDKLTGARLDAFYASLLARGLSPASVRRHHFLLHAALGRAVKWGLVPSNPADRATPPGLTRSTVAAPALADVQRLIAEAEKTDTVLATAVALAAITGARRGELCALRWSDVDSSRRVLTIARSLTVIDKQTTEGPTETHQRRDIAVDDVLRAFLVRRRAEQEGYAGTVGVSLVEDPFILSRSADGSAPCLPDGLSHQYQRLASRLGLRTHFHELRHFVATTAIAGGADVRTVAGRLGHADASVTLRVYAHALEARDRDLAGFLGSAVLGPVNGSPKPDEADPPAPPELERPG